MIQVYVSSKCFFFSTCSTNYQIIKQVKIQDYFIMEKKLTKLVKQLLLVLPGIAVEIFMIGLGH